MNSENPKNSYILLEKTDDQQGIVRDSGEFSPEQIKNRLKIYIIKEGSIEYVSNSILNLTLLINDWIRKTGGVFIFNHREIEQ